MTVSVIEDSLTNTLPVGAGAEVNIMLDANILEFVELLDSMTSTATDRTKATSETDLSQPVE